MRTFVCSILALLLCVLVVGQGCVLEDKVVELVLKAYTCVDYSESHTSAEWTHPLTVSYADSIRRIIRDNDIDVSKIKKAVLVSCSYEVTEFEHTHDWIIGGFITVARGGGTAQKIINYTDQSLEDALNAPTYADLNAGGVAIINQALNDFLANIDNPAYDIELTFTVNNGTVVSDPGGDPPTVSDPLVFKWKACVNLHFVYEEKFELPEVLP
jgi:hypothetical protein